MRSFVKKIVCSDRIIALKLKAELRSILVMQVCVPTSEYEDDMMRWRSCMTQLKKFLSNMEKVTQTYWGTGIALLEMSHIGTLLDHMDYADGITGFKCSLTFVK